MVNEWGMKNIKNKCKKLWGVRVYFTSNVASSKWIPYEYNYWNRTQIMSGKMEDGIYILRSSLKTLQLKI